MKADPTEGPLAAAQTKQALEVLLSLRKKTFPALAYRAQWLDAVATYRAPKAKKLLAEFATASDIRARVAANCGLVRNGDKAALRRLRESLDARPFDLAEDNARKIHFVLGTPFVISEEKLARLTKWWDSHPAEVAARFAKAQKKRPPE